MRKAVRNTKFKIWKPLGVLIMGFLIVSCANNDVIREPNELSDEESQTTKYLCLSVSTTGDPGSRVATTPDVNMQYGTESENYINLIRFYFFNDNGDPVVVSEKEDISGSGYNYYDWVPGNSVNNSSDVPPSTSIEKAFLALIPLQIDEENLPTRLVAIVNPSQNLKTPGNRNLGELKDVVMDFETGLTDYNFVMSNSVYVKSKIEESDGKNIIFPIGIEESNFAKNPREAANNAIEVYVERLLARIDVTFSDALETKSIGDHHNLFPVRYKWPNKESQEEIYVEFLGWAVTSSPTSSRLFKNIDSDWDDEEFFSSTYSWNAPALHRSLWAINPETIDYNWYSFTDLTGQDEEGATGERNPNCHEPDVTQTMTVYTQENANPFMSGVSSFSRPLYPTKVIFAAQLLDKDGSPVALAEYDGENYTPEGLKTLIANILNDKMFYEDSPGHYIGPDVDDIKFITSMQHTGNTGPDSKGNYLIYYGLTDAARQRIWFRDFPNEGDKEDYRIPDPEIYMNEFAFPAKIWNNGFTYYFFEIPHYEDSDGTRFPGVVRNFLYNATVNQILSLGTPVYDPEEKIYPENPPKEGNQLDVTVNTLKWRIESEDVNFTW